MMQPAIFLDRDGVINRNRLTMSSRGRVEFLPAFWMLSATNPVEWPVVVVSNQAIVDAALSAADD